MSECTIAMSESNIAMIESTIAMSESSFAIIKAFDRIRLNTNYVSQKLLQRM